MFFLECLHFSRKCGNGREIANNGRENARRSRMGGVGRELYVKRLIQTHAATQTNTNAKTKERAPHARTHTHAQTDIWTPPTEKEEDY